MVWMMTRLIGNILIVRLMLMNIYVVCDMPLRVANLRILTFNIQVCGTQVDDGINKIAKHIRLLNPDAVLLQEVVIVQFARHPIVNGSYHATNWTMGLRMNFPLSVSKSMVIALRSIHTQYLNYGPYAACNKLCTKASQIMAGEQDEGNEAHPGRVSNIIELLEDEQFRSDLENSDKVPLIIGGDFNSPSHLDWIDSTKHLHCGWSYQWPTTSILQTGTMLEDCFRELHPDVLTMPGNTWSTTQKQAEGWGYTIPEPQDRIDFLLYRATRIKPRKAQVYNGTSIIEPKPKQTRKNDWPSDHSAVVVDFDILY